MSEKPHGPIADEDSPRPGESFLGRFHRRKTEARLAESTPPEAIASDATLAVVTDAAPEPVSEAEPTDADMPPLESLSADSDYTGFLSPKVSESLRRAALRKLFHGSVFNVIDELDDYAEDFTTFEALGDIITADMRHQLEVEAKKQAEAVKQALLEDDHEADEVDDKIGEEQPQTAESAEPQSHGEQATTTDAPADSLDPEILVTHAPIR